MGGDTLLLPNAKEVAVYQHAYDALVEIYTCGACLVSGGPGAVGFWPGGGF